MSKNNTQSAPAPKSSSANTAAKTAASTEPKKVSKPVDQPAREKTSPSGEYHQGQAILENLKPYLEPFRGVIERLIKCGRGHEVCFDKQNGENGEYQLVITFDDQYLGSFDSTVHGYRRAQCALTGLALGLEAFGGAPAEAVEVEEHQPALPQNIFDLSPEEWRAFLDSVAKEVLALRAADEASASEEVSVQAKVFTADSVDDVFGFYLGKPTLVRAMDGGRFLIATRECSRIEPWELGVITGRGDWDALKVPLDFEVFQVIRQGANEWCVFVRRPITIPSEEIVSTDNRTGRITVKVAASA